MDNNLKIPLTGVINNKVVINSYVVAKIIMAETHLKTYRFLISFNEDLNMALIPLPEGTGTVNPNDKAQVLELIRHAIPMALIPDVLKEGVNRLNI